MPEPTSRLLWADKVTATRTEAALAHLIHTAATHTLPKNWQTLPTGKPAADQITAKTIRLLHQTQTPGQPNEIERLTDKLRAAQAELSIWKQRAKLAEGRQ